MLNTSDRYGLNGRWYAVDSWGTAEVIAPNAEEWALLAAQFPGWGFAQSLQTLDDGSLEIKSNEALGPSRQTAADPPAAGGSLFLQYNQNPQGVAAPTNPAPTNLHWIQFLVTYNWTGSIGRVSEIDNAGQNTPWYDDFGGAADGTGFADIGRPPVQADLINFEAHVFPVTQNAAGTWVIWPGVDWGWHVVLAPPRVGALAPAAGATGGGYAVNITGDGFTDATAVSFGGQPATSFTVNSDTSITAYVPGQAIGMTDVVVTGPGGDSEVSPEDQFAYVNGAPVGTSNTVIAPENGSYTFAAADFGFSDPNDSPANNFQAVEITTLPSAGTLTDNGAAVSAGQYVSVSDISAGYLVFTPAANAYGTPYDGFTFQVQDDGGTANGGADTDPTPRTMTVNVNRPPTAADIGPVTTSDQPVIVDVLSHCADPDGDKLTVSGVTPGTYGSVGVNADGTVTYSPDAGFVGDDTFTYTASDGHGGSATATVYVSVYGFGQWANSVIDYSSQGSSTDNAATQALGAPDTFAYGNAPTAWSASSEDGTAETLTLGYATAVYASGFTIRETDGNGFVTQVDLIATDGTAHTVFSGTDTTPDDGPRDFTVNLTKPTDYLTQSIRIYVSTDSVLGSWEEIDAVQLTGGTFKS